MRRQKMKLTDSIKPVLLVLLLTISSFAQAGEVKNKLVIQVSSDDPVTQKIALNNAVNLQKHYGMDNIIIEIVAYGPGLGLLTRKSGQASRVESLALQDIQFSACATTMKKIAKKTGKMPVLLEGVNQVPGGVIRILELQQQGYAYIRP